MLKYSKITEGASIFIQDLFKEKVLLLLPKPEWGKGKGKIVPMSLSYEVL